MKCNYGSIRPNWACSSPAVLVWVRPNGRIYDYTCGYHMHVHGAYLESIRCEGVWKAINEETLAADAEALLS